MSWLFSYQFQNKFTTLCILFSFVVISDPRINVFGQRLTYGKRVPGGLVAFNERLKIDGAPIEHWKHTVGDLAVMKCITRQNDYPVFFWSKDGKELPLDIRMYELVSNGNSFIEIAHINEKHEGRYICSVSNDYGVAKKEYRICVIKPGVKEDCPSWWYKWE